MNCRNICTSIMTIYRLLKHGKLLGFRVGSDWLFNLEAIDRWRLEQGKPTD